MKVHRIEILCRKEDSPAIIKAVKQIDEGAELAPVVRCKDCKHRTSSEFCECRPEDAFCSDGERKDNEKKAD